MRLKRVFQLGIVLLPLIFVTVFSFTQSFAGVIPPSVHIHSSHFDNIPPILGATLPENWAKESALLSPLLAPASAVGQWSNIVSWPMIAIHVVMLPNGNYLIWDREESSTRPAYVWNPTTNQFTNVPNNSVSLFCSAHLLLPDGRILISGGHDNVDNNGLAQLNIFSPVSNAWSFATGMRVGRWYPTSIALNNGRVLIVGGTATPGDPSPTLATIPEIYDPASNKITQLTNAPLAATYYPQLYLMPSGNKVFLMRADDDRSYILDLTTQRWSAIGAGAGEMGTSSVSYAPGKVLWEGRGQSAVGQLMTNSVVGHMTAPPAYARTNATMVVLPDGNVFTVGGSSDGTNDAAAGVLMPEMWNAKTETWSQLTPMQVPRLYHSTAFLLLDGRVVVAGTGHGGGAPDTFNAEIYSPAYLFKGARPTIQATGASGSQLGIQTTAGSTIGSVALISFPSVTHGFNMNQRFVPLTFQQVSGGLIATIPTNRNTVPPGYYMVFIVNKQGVPSVGKIVRVT